MTQCIGAEFRMNDGLTELDVCFSFVPLSFGKSNLCHANDALDMFANVVSCLNFIV